MSKTPFIITVDTEGDNLWEKPREIITRNAAFLPRFQMLCERFRFKPVYLTNYEMAMSEVFLDFARDVFFRGSCEIGMHLHAWNSSSIEPLTSDDYYHQPYLVEFPDRTMKEKIHVMTRLLEDRFSQKIISHRAGRWAFDGRYAAMLRHEGYLVDCSVTPGVDWSASMGDPNGNGGSNYANFPSGPYFLNPADISASAPDGLLEVPMTILASRLYRRASPLYRIPLLRRAVNRISPGLSWFYPVQPSLGAAADRQLDIMLQMTRSMRSQGVAPVEFMLHSSELMPGGSPNFQSASHINQLYERLEIVFEELSTWCRGMTLSEFRDWWIKSPGKAGTPGLEDKPVSPLSAGGSVATAAIAKQSVAG